MKYLLNISFFLLVLTFLTSCSTKNDNILRQSKDEPGIAKTYLNVSYGTDEEQSYDIYLPANRSTATTKVLVFIHGGGWVQGDKSDMQAYIQALQKNHPFHAIVNMNYRLAQQPLTPAFPNQFLDVKLALDHLKNEADKLNIKPEFGLIGVSAGAHLALQYDNFYDDPDLVKMVCSIVGPTDLTDPYYNEKINFEMALELLVDESAYPGIKDYAKAISPAYHVGEHSSATILFYGEDDELVPVSNGIFLHEQLEEAGVSNSFTIYKGGHGDWVQPDHLDLQLKLKDFIDVHLPI